METRTVPHHLEHHKFFPSLGIAFGSRRPSFSRHRSKPEMFQRNKSFSFDAGSRNLGCDPYHSLGFKFHSTQNSPIVSEFDSSNDSQISLSEKPRRFLRRKPRITVSCTREELIEENMDLKHSKRDSVLSVISPTSKTDEIPAMNEGYQGPEELGLKEYPSIYSPQSLSSNKSPLIPSPLPTGTFSDTSKELSLSMSRSSLNSSFASSLHSSDDLCEHDFSGSSLPSPEGFRKRLPWHDERKEEPEEELEEDPDKLICYSSQQTSSYQEQEFRIAKAWLEAEELRKAKCQMDGGLTGSISMCGSSCQSQPWTIDVLSSNYKHVEKSASIKSPFFRSAGHGEFKDEDTLEEDGIDKNYRNERDDYLDHIPCTESRELGILEKKTNRKRLSAISTLSHGMRGWLSRRASSH